MTDAELVDAAKKDAGTLRNLARKIGITERTLQYLLTNERGASPKLRKKLEALAKVKS